MRFGTAQAAQLNKRLEKLLDDLHVQSILFKSLRSAFSATELSNLSKHLALTLPFIANFARKAKNIEMPLH